MGSYSDAFGADFAAGLSGFLRGDIKSPHHFYIAPCCAFFLLLRVAIRSVIYMALEGAFLFVSPCCAFLACCIARRHYSVFIHSAILALPLQRSSLLHCYMRNSLCFLVVVDSSMLPGAFV